MSVDCRASRGLVAIRGVRNRALSAKVTLEELYRPFRAYVSFKFVSPGRCPGLICCALSGHSFYAATLPGWTNCDEYLRGPLRKGQEQVPDSALFQGSGARLTVLTGYGTLRVPTTLLGFEAFLSPEVDVDIRWKHRDACSGDAGGGVDRDFL